MIDISIIEFLRYIISVIVLNYILTQRIYIYTPIGSMYGIYANIWGILMVNVTIYNIHRSYGYIYIYPGSPDTVF